MPRNPDAESKTVPPGPAHQDAAPHLPPRRKTTVTVGGQRGVVTNMTLIPAEQADFRRYPEVGRTQYEGLRPGVLWSGWPQAGPDRKQEEPLERLLIRRAIPVGGGGALSLWCRLNLISCPGRHHAFHASVGTRGGHLQCVRLFRSTSPRRLFHRGHSVLGQTLFGPLLDRGNGGCRAGVDRSDGVPSLSPVLLGGGGALVVNERMANEAIGFDVAWPPLAYNGPGRGAQTQEQNACKGLPPPATAAAGALHTGPHGWWRCHRGPFQALPEELIDRMLVLHDDVLHVFPYAAGACVWPLPAGFAMCFPRCPAVPLSPDDRIPRWRRG